jgi:hypothetical protein
MARATVMPPTPESKMPIIAVCLLIQPKVRGKGWIGEARGQKEKNEQIIWWGTM